MLEFREFSASSKGNPKQLVILLHGYGSNKDDLINIAPEISKYLPNAHFISPNACQRFENAPEYDAYQWFSLVNRSQEAMLNGANTAMKILEPFILEQMKRFSLSAKQTVILGFSQGGMMALHTGLNMKENPRVLLCYSGLLIQGENSNIDSFAEVNSIQDIVLIHGKDDDVVPIESMQRSAILLVKSGARLHTLTCRALGHGIDMVGLEFGGRILKSVFNDV